MTIHEIREAINLPHEEISKSDTGIPTDSFREDGIHVFYRQPGVCEAIEFYSPSKVYLQQVNLLNEPYDRVKSFFSALDDQLEEDDAGLTSRKLGVGIYAPYHRDLPNDSTKSVIVFEDGYYER